MDTEQAREIMKGQEARVQLRDRALEELGSKLQYIVDFNKKSRIDAIKGVRELLRERYPEELKAIPCPEDKDGNGNVIVSWRYHADFMIAREIVRLLNP